MATLADPFAPPIAILAGNGAFPVEIARAITGRGGEVVIVGIDGEAGSGLDAFGVTRVGWGEINKILRTFRGRGCRELVIVGGVTRPDLARIRFDLGLISNLPELIRLVRSGGDDGVLRAVVRFFEARGFTVLSPADVAPELVVGAGPLGHCEPTAGDIGDVLLGSSIVKALAPFDIGQGVVVSRGRIEAIEAVEGTNRMISHVAAARGRPAKLLAAHGVLVKRPKPGQELRVDLPAIGPETVERAAEAGLAGLAVLAGQTLVAARAETAARADQGGLFVYGFTDGDAKPAGPVPHPGADPARRASAVSRIKPDSTALADAAFAAKALARIGETCPAAALVVRRGHVLGIEPQGNVIGLFGRVARHTQWGERRLGRRIGIAVLAAEAMLDEAGVAAAAEGRLTGIVLLRPLSSASREALIEAANTAGLFLMEWPPEGGRA